MQSPGLFCQDPDRSFPQDDTRSPEEVYLEALRGVTSYEAQGRVDLPVMADLLLNGLIF